MQENHIRKIFCIIFLIMLFIPLITINLKDGVISDAENRYLAPKAKLYNEEGKLNRDFFTDFESWINDNIGLRSSMVMANANIQYRLFRVLSNNSDMYLGPNGELNYATSNMLADYQHNNLYEQPYIDMYCSSMQTISDYIEEHGSSFFYFQCWDKHSIYPEQFPKGVLQHGSLSKTDMMVAALKEKTDVSVVSPKTELIDAKGTFDTYSRWGDPTHWNTRGSIIGFNSLLQAMNEKNGTDFSLLTDDDFIISLTDQGTTVFGGIHEPDYQESFEFIKEEDICDTKEKLTLFVEDQRSAWLTNSLAPYEETVLLIADSYFASYCIFDFSYLFKNVIYIHMDHIEDLPQIIETYPADYVIMERAEREDSSQAVINTAEKIHSLEHPCKVFETKDLYVDEEQFSSEYIVLNPDSIQYGPYSPLDKGKYKVMVYGTGFSKLTEECIYINPNSWYGIIPENVIIQDNCIEYSIQVVDDLYKLELGIINSTDKEVEIEKIELYRL